jgi:hypothetical protein
MSDLIFWREITILKPILENIEKEKIFQQNSKVMNGERKEIYSILFIKMNLLFNLIDQPKNPHFGWH